MSKFNYTKGADTVDSRVGEFYEVSSTYRTTRSLPKSIEDYPHNNKFFTHLEADVDELLNKPRRFFDTLLTAIECTREADPMAKDREEHYNHLIKGAEMWLSAVENGLYCEVMKLATPAKSERNK